MYVGVDQARDCVHALGIQQTCVLTERDSWIDVDDPVVADQDALVRHQPTGQAVKDRDTMEHEILGTRFLDGSGR